MVARNTSAFAGRTTRHSSRVYVLTSVSLFCVFLIFLTLNYFILPFITRCLECLGQSYRGRTKVSCEGLTHTVIYLKLTQNISIISIISIICNSENFRNAAKWKKSIQTVNNHVNFWSAKLRCGHSGALPQIYRKPVFSQH